MWVSCGRMEESWEVRRSLCLIRESFFRLSCVVFAPRARSGVHTCVSGDAKHIFTPSSENMVCSFCRDNFQFSRFSSNSSSTRESRFSLSYLCKYVVPFSLIAARRQGKHRGNVTMHGCCQKEGENGGGQTHLLKWCYRMAPKNVRQLCRNNRFNLGKLMWRVN